MKPNSFSKYLRAVRAKAELSQAGLAKALGVPTATLQSWELGARRPKAYSETTLRQRCEALNIGGGK